MLAPVAVLVWLHGRAENATKCLHDDPAGCTALIESGHEATANLAIDYYNRGNDFSRQHIYDQAIADDSKAIALNPAAANFYDARAIAYAGKGLNDAAIADYTKSHRAQTG